MVSMIIAESCPKFQVRTFYLILLPKPSKHQPLYVRPSLLSPCRQTLKISCRREKDKIPPGDALAAELSLEIKKLNSHAAQREEALQKSTEILFAEVCKITGLKSEELKKKWRKMSEDEKLVVAKGFVSAWSDRFHPLSARSVKDMVDEYLRNADDPGSSASFPDLKKLFGFSGHDEE